MAKTATAHALLPPEIKKEAESILKIPYNAGELKEWRVHHP